MKRIKKTRNDTSGLKFNMAKARQRQNVDSAQAWKICRWILVDFDEAMTIQYLDIVLEPKIWRENATNDRNSVNQVTCQAHAVVTFL